MSFGELPRMILVERLQASEATMTPPADSSSQSTSGPEVALLFIGVSLGLGALCRQLLRNSKMPYTVAILLIGIALGALDHQTNLGKLGESIKMWSNIDPDLVLFIFLPALLFEGAFSFEIHQIKRCMFQIFLLAVPGVVISTACLGVSNKFALPYGWNWSTSLLLGALLSSTDPVAVVALLKDLGASKKLSTIIDGESLMNDGMAIVVFQLFLKVTLGEVLTAGGVITNLIRVFFGGIALGVAFSIVSLLWLQTVFNDYIIEVTLTLTASYMAFYVANDVTGMSGVLSDMTLGIFFAIFAKMAFTGESERGMHHFWEMVAFIANTLIFTLSGVVIAETILDSGSFIQAEDWGYLLVLYLFVQLSRLIVVLVLYPGLAASGYGIHWKEATILVWGGLRGAVALTLALLISHERHYDKISQLTQARIMFLTGGVVFLTLTINGSTTQFLFSLLKLNKTSDIKKRVMNYTRQEMYDRALRAFEETGEDEELGPADWQTVRKYLSCLKIPQHDLTRSLHGASDLVNMVLAGGSTMGDSHSNKQQLHPHSKRGMREPDAEEAHRQQLLQDTRVRFLNGVQAAYWRMNEEGRINQTAALLLMQSVGEAIDLTVKEHQLVLWRTLTPHVRMPPYLRDIHRKFRGALPARALNWLTVDRLELATSMSAAYLRASAQARLKLQNFLGRSPVAESVIVESEAEESEAKKFLEDMRLNFPEILTIIKTKQVTYAILTELSDYVRNLEGAGLLDTKETNHLHDAVQHDLKRLQRSPPVVEMLPASEVLQRQPLIGAMPGDVRMRLIHPLKEYTKLSGNVLYRQGEEAEGVWLIASGIARWYSKESADKLVLHPLFAHGSTVGLYECLAGIPHIATVAADSVLHCFFLDLSKIQAACKSAEAVADFLWKESVLELARILLPQAFGVLSMHDLRVLFAESASHPKLHPAGSLLEVGEEEVAFLLQGVVLLVGEEEQEAEAEEVGKEQDVEGQEDKVEQDQKDSRHGRERRKSNHFGMKVLAPACLVFHSNGGRAAEPEEGMGEGDKSPVRSSQYRVISTARVIVVELPGARAVAGGGADQASITTTPRSSSFRLMRQDSHDHDGLLQWRDTDSIGPEDLDEAMNEQTLSHTTELGNLLRERLEAESKMTERAMQLSVFGSKMGVTQSGSRLPTRRPSASTSRAPEDMGGSKHPTPAAALATGSPLRALHVSHEEPRLSLSCLLPPRTSEDSKDAMVSLLQGVEAEEPAVGSESTTEAERESVSNEEQSTSTDSDHDREHVVNIA